MKTVGGVRKLRHRGVDLVDWQLTFAAAASLRRRRLLHLLPHLDTPLARTLSQSSVQENPRALHELTLRAGCLRTLAQTLAGLDAALADQAVESVFKTQEQARMKRSRQRPFVTRHSQPIS